MDISKQMKECIKGLQKLLSDAEFASDCSNEEELCQMLSDGEILCTVLTQLSNGRISNDDGTYFAINSSFMARSNLQFFRTQCLEEFGMQEEEVFEPDELLEMSNAEKVISTIHKLLNRPGVASLEPRRQSTTSVGSGEMENVIKEICDHESSLVDKLTKLLLYRAQLLGLLSEWSEDFVRVVFAHVEQLYIVHKEFHAKLADLADQGCERFCIRLSTVFREMAPKLEIYKQYFSHLPTANTRMEEEFKKSPVLKDQLHKLERHFNNGQCGLTFRALFDSPIRQMTSCLMLYKRLQDSAKKDMPHAAALIGEAVADMSKLLDRANEYKRQAEQLAVTKAMLGQIDDLPIELRDPAQIGLHQADDCFKVRTVNDHKAETKVCTCLLTTKQLIVASRLQKKQCQSTFSFHVPIVSILEVKVCEKPSSLEIIRENGERIAFEGMRRANELEKWKQMIEHTVKLNKPCGWNSLNHQFELKTFPEDTRCSKCGQVLSGSFLQGYSCSHCCGKSNFHVHCFEQFVEQQTQFLDHGKVSRERLSQLLTGKPNGTFLIRDNTTGGKALSIMFSNEIKHINIVMTDGKFSLGQGTKSFPSLSDMLAFYRENAMSIHFSAIACRLGNGITVCSSAN